MFFILIVDLSGIERNATKESQIKIGEEGVQIAKNISRHMKIAVDNGSLSLNVNGTVFITNKESLHISKPKPYCSKGQTFRDGYCCKYDRSELYLHSVAPYFCHLTLVTLHWSLNTLLVFENWPIRLQQLCDAELLNPCSLLDSCQITSFTFCISIANLKIWQRCQKDF